MAKHMGKKHPLDTDLALFAGGGPAGDLDFLDSLRIRLHLRGCEGCRNRVAELREVRTSLSEYLMAEPKDLDQDLDWNSLALEMRANIRLGLAAGECVRPVRTINRLDSRLGVAFASLCILACSAYFLRSGGHAPAARTLSAQSVPSLAATGSGLELREGASSLTLLNQDGAVSNQTVGSQGEIRSRYVDSKTGSVTINNVYLDD